MSFIEEHLYTIRLDLVANKAHVSQTYCWYDTILMRFTLSGSIIMAVSFFATSEQDFRHLSYMMRLSIEEISESC